MKKIKNMLMIINSFHYETIHLMLLVCLLFVGQFSHAQQADVLDNDGTTIGHTTYQNIENPNYPLVVVPSYPVATIPNAQKPMTPAEANTFLNKMRKLSHNIDQAEQNRMSKMSTSKRVMVTVPFDYVSFAIAGGAIYHMQLMLKTESNPLLMVNHIGSDQLYGFCKLCDEPRSLCRF
jgi:hypothetical protein